MVSPAWINDYILPLCLHTALFLKAIILHLQTPRSRDTLKLQHQKNNKKSSKFGFIWKHKAILSNGYSLGLGSCPSLFFKKSHYGLIKVIVCTGTPPLALYVKRNMSEIYTPHPHQQQEISTQELPLIWDAFFLNQGLVCSNALSFRG